MKQNLIIGRGKSAWKPEKKQKIATYSALAEYLKMDRRKVKSSMDSLGYSLYNLYSLFDYILHMQNNKDNNK